MKTTIAIIAVLLLQGCALTPLEKIAAAAGVAGIVQSATGTLVNIDALTHSDDKK